MPVRESVGIKSQVHWSASDAEEARSMDSTLKQRNKQSHSRRETYQASSSKDTAAMRPSPLELMSHYHVSQMLDKEL